MTAAAATAPESLTFAHSESKTVGFGGKAVQWLRNNAPRVVGGLKLAGDITVGFSLNPFLIGYSVFSGIGRVVMLVYGTKENQQKAASNGVETQEKPDDSWLANLKKGLHPKQYPVESSSLFSIVGEASALGYGISQFIACGAGITPMILEPIAIWSYANMLFTKEETTKEKAKTGNAEGSSNSLTFAQSKSKSLGFTGRIKEMIKGNPVLVSSVVQLGLVGAMVTGALIEGLSMALVVAGGFYVSALVVQALFVRKNEFNVEGAKDKDTKTPQPTQRMTLEEKIAARNQRGAEPA